MEYIFTLKFQLAGQDQDYDDLVECLGAAGCDDALVGIGQPGRFALAFNRDAVTAKAAIFSALADVKKAAPSATLLEATPDFVGLTDVAELVGMTRQNLRKLMLQYGASFPAPVHEGSAAVWHLADVLGWLQGRGSYAIEQAALDVALITLQVNLARQQQRLAPKLQREVAALLA